MSKWYCSLSETYYEYPDSAMDACREFIEDNDYLEHVQEIEAGRLFQALSNPQLAQEIFDEIVEATETYFFENYVTEEEDEEENEEE